MATASILTIGNELVSGDVPNTNGSWLAKRLAPLGVETRLLAAVPDEIEPIAEFVRDEAPRVDFLIVTGGLGGTPDDLTREAIAHAFGVEQVEVPDLAADLRARFARESRVRRALGAAARGAAGRSRTRSAARPASRSRTSTSCPGLPAEMEAMFDCDRRGVPARQPDRRVAAVVPDARERDRAGAHRGRRALARRADRLVPDVRRRRPDGRGRRQVERRRRAARGVGVARGGVSARTAQPTAGRTPRSRT